MSRPKRRRSRLAPALIILLILALAAGAAWYFLFRTPDGLADTELTGFLPGNAAITANATEGKTQTVDYSYATTSAYCDAQTAARLTFRYADGSWTPDEQEEVLSRTEDWSRLAGTWTDEAEPDLTVVIQAFQDGAVAGTVTYTEEHSGMFDDYFAAGQREEDGSYQFAGKGVLAGTYLRIEPEAGLKFNNLGTPMEKDAKPKPTPTPARTLEIEKDGETETVDAAASPSPAPVKTLVTTAVLNVRPEPNTDKEPMATLEPGTVLTYTSSENGWYQVQYQAQIGYVSGTYIQDLSAPDCPTVTVLTASSAVNVRSGPGTGYQVLTTVDAGGKMISVGLSNGWYQVRYNDGYGYVAFNYATAGEVLN